MKRSLSHCLFTAALALAFTLTFSCSSDDVPAGSPPDGNSSAEMSSSSSEPSSSNEPSSSSVPCGGEYDVQTQRCENDIVETKCGDEWYDAADENHRCQNDVVETVCGIGWYNPSTQFCHDDTPVEKCGGAVEYTPGAEQCCGSNKYVLATQFCYDDTPVEKCGGTVEYTPGTEECCGSSKRVLATQFCYNGSSVGDFCGNNPQKSYNPSLYECELGSNGIYLKGGVSDGSQTYKAVLIGNQTWMAENLNVTPTAGNSWCYLNDPANCVKYGSLYDWATANSACPANWHLPTQDDWDKLTDVVGGASTEGKNLKATSGWNNCGPAGSGKGYACEDTYGFSALPGGYYYNSSFLNAGNRSDWWSSSEISSSAYNRYMNYNNEAASWDGSNKSYGFSVRCLADVRQ